MTPAPWRVTGAECRTCYTWVHDNERMEDGECMRCSDERQEAIEREEEEG